MTVIKDLGRVADLLIEARQNAEQHCEYSDITELVTMIEDAETLCEDILADAMRQDKKRYNASPKFRVGSEAEEG